MLGNAILILGRHVPSEKLEVLQLQGQRADTKGQLSASSPQLSAGYESRSKHNDNGKAESDGLKKRFTRRNVTKRKL